MNVLPAYQIPPNNISHNSPYTIKVTVVCLLLFISASKIFNQSRQTQKILESIDESIVPIYVYGHEGQIIKKGNGLIFSDKGYLITNYHLLHGSYKQEVKFSDQSLNLTDIIGMDVEKDILVYKISGSGKQKIKMNKIFRIENGMGVYILSGQMNSSKMFYKGKIVNDQSIDDIHRYFIQINTDMPVFSSGNAVVNLRGELLGITTTNESGLFYAVPLEDKDLTDLLDYSARNENIKNCELFYESIDAIEKGDYRNAIEYLSECSERNPAKAGLYYFKGYAKYSNYDPEGAIQDFNRAIELDSTDAAFYYNRGQAKSRLKNYEGAIADYDKSIKLKSNYSESYYARACAYDDIKNYSKAEKDYSKVIQFEPKLGSAYFSRGIVKYNSGNKSGACLDWSKALELGYAESKNLIGKYCRNKSGAANKHRKK